MFLVIATALAALAVFMVLTAGVGLYFATGDAVRFLYSALICIVCGSVFWLVGMAHRTHHLYTRQMFMITGGTWLFIPFFASLPLVISRTDISLTDAVFETVSGLTTTGSTIFSNLNSMQQDLLLWRSVLQWLGGIGIICMAVAVLPFLKVGGMRLFQTESSHWSDENSPRAQKLVKFIIYVYILLTLVCAVAYFLSGMTALEALNHAFTTISTGGYSTSDQSFINRSLLTQWIAIVFMLAGATPFVLYVNFLNNRKTKILRDNQVKGMLVTVALISLALSLNLYFSDIANIRESITHAFFNMTSIITTTGFVSADYASWGNFSICLFFFAVFIGGCSGSTSGGVKIFRFQLFAMLFKEQLEKAVHPRITKTRHYNGQIVSNDVITSLVAFTFALVASLIILTLCLSLTNLDLLTSFTGAATALTNTGPGLGNIIGPVGNFSTLSDPAKWMLSIGMIMGRLEFLTILILFTPSYWRG